MCFKEMYKDSNNLFRRVVWGKSIGFLLSLIVVISFLVVVEDPGNYTALTWGLLFWYTTIGGIVALMGTLDYHPLLKWRISHWRGAIVGGWMNFLMILFAYPVILSAIKAYGCELSGILLVVAAVLEGIIVGWLLDYGLTKKFGEGKSLLEKPEQKAPQPENNEM